MGLVITSSLLKAYDSNLFFFDYNTKREGSSPSHGIIKILM
jgi:hypothetical protein